MTEPRAKRAFVQVEFQKVWFEKYGESFKYQPTSVFKDAQVFFVYVCNAFEHLLLNKLDSSEFRVVVSLQMGFKKYDQTLGEQLESLPYFRSHLIPVVKGTDVLRVLEEVQMAIEKKVLMTNNHLLTSWLYNPVICNCC